MPDLDANANAVAIQTIKLENEGWERDYDVRRARGAELRRTVEMDDAAKVALPGTWTTADGREAGAWLRPITGADQAAIIDRIRPRPGAGARHRLDRGVRLARGR